MNKTFLIPAALSAAVMLTGVACTPSKEDAPPKPKVMASTAPESAASASIAKPNTLAAAAPASGTMASLPKLGPAPAWKLQDLNGKPVTSDQFKGKVVIVDFWATWCPPCREEIPGYIELQKKYGNEGVVIIGVSLDQGGPAVVKPFAAKYQINYPLVMGDEQIVAAFGGVEGIPTTFLIDRSGQVRDRKVGSEETASYEKKIASVLGEKT